MSKERKLQTYDMVKALSANGILLKLKASSFSGRFSDKELSNKYAEENHGISKAWNVNIQWFPKDFLSEISAIINRARHALEMNSIMFGEDSWRLAPQKHYGHIEHEINEARSELIDYMDSLLSDPAKWQKVIDCARNNLGEAFDETKIRAMNKETLRSKVSMKLIPKNVPIATAFDGMDSKKSAELEAEIEKSVLLRYSTGTKELAMALHETLNKIVKEVEEPGKKTQFNTLGKKLEDRLVNILRMEMFESPTINKVIQDTVETVGKIISDNGNSLAGEDKTVIAQKLVKNAKAVQKKIENIRIV